MKAVSFSLFPVVVSVWVSPAT